MKLIYLNLVTQGLKNTKDQLGRRRKKLDQQDGSSDKVTQKKRKGDRSKDRDQRSSIKKRKKLEDPSHGCYDVSPVSDDAMDLTLEDLMAIAEQVIF